MPTETSSEKKWYAQIKEFGTDFFEPFLKVLVNLWVPAFTAVLSFIFFFLIPQTLEIYRVFALNPCQEVIRIICSFISIFILSLLIWYSGRNLLLKEDEKPDDSNSFLNRAKKWLPRFLGCLPIVALGLGLLKAKNGISLEGSAELNNQAWIAHFLFITPFLLFITYWIFVVFRHRLNQKIHPILFSPGFLLFLNFLSILILAIFTFPLVIDDKPTRLIVIIFMLFLQYLLSWFLARESTISQKDNIFLDFFPSLIRLCGVSKKEKKIIYRFLFLSTLILLLVAYLPYFVSNPLASKIGSVSVIALFLMVCVFWGSLLFDYGKTTGIPFIVILLIFAIVFSGLDWNDNHHLRELSSSKQSVVKDLKTSFNDWINFPSRKAEIEKFNNNRKAYPIYIVSAQGGGIYAAYHAALTLSRLQDSFPAFASHVFAISGVSGGSLGTAVFSSLLKEPPSSATNDNKQNNGLGPLAQKAHYVLDNDFLSPLLSAGLFPDFVQRFLPVIPISPLSSISEGVDRARGIEYAFEQGWDRAQDKWNKDDPQKDNPLRNSYYEHWKPEGTAPALVLNTTVVETGERLVLSPFKIDLPYLKDIRTVACKEKDNKEIDFPLSTAAILSARFTLVTPVGWFDRCDSEKDGKNLQQKARLADGGYFENSGISTAYEIGKRLEEILEKDIKDKKIKVIYLALTDQPSSEIPKAGGFNEVMSPIGAALNSWQKARGLSAIAQIEYLVDIANADPNSRNDSDFQKKYANHHFRQFYLHDVNLAKKKPFSTFDLPLGWFLSKYSQDFIQEQIGYIKAIDNSKNCPNNLAKGSHNNCVFRSIKEELAL